MEESGVNHLNVKALLVFDNEDITFVSAECPVSTVSESQLKPFCKIIIN